MTFEGQLAAANVPTMAVVSSLTGTNPTVAVATTTTGVAAITVLLNATLTVDDSLVDVPTRLAAANSITLYGSQSERDVLNFLGNNSPGVITTASLGYISLAGGNSTINSQQGSVTTDSTVLTAAGLLPRPRRRRDLQHPGRLPGLWQLESALVHLAARPDQWHPPLRHGDFRRQRHLEFRHL